MFDLAPLFTPEGLVALLTLTGLEIVLGIDNIIFIAILSGKLPEHQRVRARNIGLIAAMAQRIVLVMLVGWIVQLEQAKLFTLFDIEFSIRDAILIVGGVFLLAKSTTEIHDKIEGDPEGRQQKKASASFGAVIGNILLLDMVFSVDSVLTAVGLTRIVPVMVIAVVASVIVMIIYAGVVVRFIEKHPSLKMLALAFLVTIGVLLIAEGFHVHVPRGYVYFAMAFSLGVEVLNILARKKRVAAGAGAGDGADD